MESGHRVVDVCSRTVADDPPVDAGVPDDVLLVDPPLPALRVAPPTLLVRLPAWRFGATAGSTTHDVAGVPHLVTPASPSQAGMRCGPPWISSRAAS